MKSAHIARRGIAPIIEITKIKRSHSFDSTVHHTLSSLITVPQSHKIRSLHTSQTLIRYQPDTPSRRKTNRKAGPLHSIMFTGLVRPLSLSSSTSLPPTTDPSYTSRSQVEHVVTISSITPASSFEGFTFTFKDAKSILGDCHIGDSICVNGACLTVTEFDEDTFKVGLAPETLSRTNLGESRSDFYWVL